MTDAERLLDRATDLLVDLLDKPLAVLPGGDPGGPDGPTDLRLQHFRPDLTEKIAELLEEVGK